MKKLAIIGSVTCVIGAIIFISAFASIGWDITNISTRPEYEERYFSTENTNQTITLKDKDKPVSVGLSDDNQIHIIYYENEKERYQIEDNTNLTIQNQYSYQWYESIFNIDFQSPSTTILLPSDFNGELYIETSNAQVTIENIAASKLSASTSNGYMNVNRLTNVQTISLSTSNNAIDAPDITASGKLTAATTNGSIAFTNISAQDMEAVTSNNRIVTDNTQSTQNMMLQTSNGTIEFKNLTAGLSTTLHTSNGSVIGSINGKASDFTIHSQTFNGTNNLPENFKSGEHQLNITTSNGNIDVTFSNE